MPLYDFKMTRICLCLCTRNILMLHGCSPQFYLIISVMIHSVRNAIMCIPHLIVKPDNWFLFCVRCQPEFLRSCICSAVCFLVVLTTAFAPAVQGMKVYVGCGNSPYQLTGLFDEQLVYFYMYCLSKDSASVAKRICRSNKKIMCSVLWLLFKTVF